jgi:hypothetical protein
MYLLEIFCQTEQIEDVLKTLHNAGVDVMGNYDHCWAIGSFTGSHRALDGANPLFGASGGVENYPLSKIEINVDDFQVAPIVKELKTILEWEEPLVNVLKLFNDEFDF